MIRIAKYNRDQKAEWDAFVRGAKNATFLHLRDYMDYHSDRFADYSLMAYSGERLVAVLPANRVGAVLHSHQGLTYGGWITHTHHFNVTTMLEVMDAMKAFVTADGIVEMTYKAIPHIYHSYPAEEDQYALFMMNAQVVVSNVSTTIDLTCPLPFNTGAKSSVVYAAKHGVEIAESTDFEEYWQVLSQLLKERYQTTPVHSLEEIKRLKTLFADNIRLFTATKDGKVLGGVVMYFAGQVAHSQYTAATAEGWQLRVIPAIYNHIIHNECKGLRYLDFGISNEDGGRYLNEGLVLQKVGMGGRAIAYNTYKLEF